MVRGVLGQSNELESVHKALVAIYESSNGDQWIDNSGWDINEVPPTIEHFGQWYGLTVEDGKLVEIILNRNNLNGMISPKFGDLGDLEIIHLGFNQLTGEIPAELGNLTQLNLLYLLSNSLTGEIPSELGNLANLADLRLSNNKLSGEIPSELGNLSKLWRLSLDLNLLTGKIPPQLGKLSNLVTLTLESNQLFGEIPAELGQLERIDQLMLWDNNLSGEIPSELGNLTNMTALNLTHNDLSGTLPRSFIKLYLFTFRWHTNTGHLCAPADADFQAWLVTILYRAGPTCQGISLTSGISNMSYPNGQPITPVVFPEAVRGASPITYSLSPTLPAGLNFDSTTRTLDGTPTEVTPPISFTYTATGTDSMQVSQEFTIEIYASTTAEDPSALPEKFIVHSNYPNPFRYSTYLRFSLPWPAHVATEVFDVTGRQVYSDSPIYFPAGWNHEIELSDMTLPSGAYMYRLTASYLHGIITHSRQLIRVE